MDAFELSRKAAEDLHAKALARKADPLRPATLIDAALTELTIEVNFVPSTDTDLCGARALFDSHLRLILCDSAASPAERLLLIAHELGHATAEGASIGCAAADIDPSRSIESAPVGLQRVEDYGVRERRELLANVFAREFLLPRGVARREFLEAGATARTLATRTGLPLDIVRQQLLDALLLPIAPASLPSPPESKRSADPSQDVAAAHRGRPFQLQAGPGTGKTRTLVKRVVGLMNEGVDPASILVLTFSNRAAGELAERIARETSESPVRVWIGTFHAFGLDLVRRYYDHDRLKLAADPVLFDRSDAIEVLEELLPTLPLAHYRNLWDPVLSLQTIIGGISRAKDELVDAAAYRALAEAMRERAGSDDEVERAEKCLEVATVYDAYEAALASQGAVDFGDLIMRPAMLLEAAADVRDAVRERHQHVLVDEYQDMNRASARLLQAVAGDGSRLWVVGDARQSIYRFRGASSLNMESFAEDFPGATADQLAVSYRSSAEVVAACCTFAKEMTASDRMLALALTADRGESGIRPEIRVFDDPGSEARGVAASVRELERAGVPLRSQAILCRSNGTVNDIAEELEAQGIPILHLGSIFERDDVRNLLALVQLTVDPWGDGLARAGAMPEYGVPLADVHALIHHARGSERRALTACADADAVPNLSDSGRVGLKRIAADLSACDVFAMPWETLTTYLLDGSALLRRLAQSDTVADRMSCLAIWQLANFSRDFPRKRASVPGRRFLDRIRRLVMLAEERDLRQIPAAALHIDAVRLMTVHGSKGLEFDAVHIPGMTVSSFPMSNRGERCPAPEGLIPVPDGSSPTERAKLAHETEEQCLFFVALSRARTHARLYRSSTMANGNNRKASPFLSTIAGHARTASDPLALPPVQNHHGHATPVPVTWPTDAVLTEEHIDGYIDCPRRFFYTNVLGLGGARTRTAFTKTHDCIYALMEWLAKNRAAGAPSLADAERALESIWNEQGPKAHAFAKEYRAIASSLMKALIDFSAGRVFHDPTAVVLTFPAGRVAVTPDEQTIEPDGTVVWRRVRTKKSSKGDAGGVVEDLYHLAGLEVGRKYRVDVIHLADAVTKTVPPPKKLQVLRDTIAETVMDLRAGHFPAKPNTFSCPRCPHFFVCAATPTGPLPLA